MMGAAFKREKSAHMVGAGRLAPPTQLTRIDSDDPRWACVKYIDGCSDFLGPKISFKDDGFANTIA